MDEQQNNDVRRILTEMREYKAKSDALKIERDRWKMMAIGAISALSGTIMAVITGLLLSRR